MAAVAALRNDLRENELSVIFLPFGDLEDGLLRLPVQACEKAQRTLIKIKTPASYHSTGATILLTGNLWWRFFLPELILH